MLRIFFVLIVTGIVGSKAYSQPAASQNFLPKVLPASPDAASIARYGNVPVNLYTGVPDISIPLYEIEVGELKVPITLSYHAGGNKVSDIPSRVGLGWSISAGGTITRKMMSKPDEQEGNYLSGITSKNSMDVDAATQAGIDYLWGVSQGDIDAEPDIFSYNLPGKSGRFIFNQRDNFKPILIPYNPISISRTNPTQFQMFFSILDESGIQYKFDDGEISISGNGSSSTTAISTWLLTKMLSANKQDSIIFTYFSSNETKSNDLNDAEYIVINDAVVQTENIYYPDLGTGYVSHGYNYTDGKLLQEIKFKNGKVVFEASSQPREDFNSVTAPNRINAIKLYNFDIVSNTYKLLKTIQFYHSYFINGTDAWTKRLRLDSISILNSAGVHVDKYKFEYNTAVGLPKKDSKMKDYWGYFNNKDNSSLVPRMLIPYTISTSTENIWIGSNILNGREPDPLFNNGWIIKKIIYPTGGFSEFDFESHKFLDGQNNLKYGGGLRIRQIRSYDGISLIPLKKTFIYGANESSYGRANFTLNNYFFQSTQTYRSFASAYSDCGPTASKRVRTYFSNPTIDIEPYDGSTVVYPFVTEYNGDSINNQGRTIYEFNDRPDGLSSVSGLGKPIITTYHFNRGQVIDQVIQKKSAAGYKNVNRTQNKYEYFPEQFFPYLGFISFKWRINTAIGDNIKWDPINSGTCPSREDTYSYQYGNYSIRTGDNRIKETTQILYNELDDTKFVSNTTKYFYDNINHLQITRIETTNSKGETIVNSKKYPHDYPTTSPYNMMIANSIIDKVVEDKITNVTVSNSIVSLKKTNFTSWGNGNFLPNSIDLQIGSSSSETRAAFSKYNFRGGIQEMQKTLDQKMVYIYDYQSSLPIAEASNANETDVAYTSFESDGKGNWAFSGSLLNDPSAITGKRSYKLNNGSISKSGLTTSTIYIISYWTKNNSALSIAGTVGSPVENALVNGWRCWVHKVTGVTSITVSGSGFIDELRLVPADAQITTFTFEPLLGITSRNDNNNRISYFEYDALGRLKIIKDQNQNVLKVYCYNYSGQIVNCGDIYKNSAYTQSFIKNNCGTGYTGSSVAYTVSQGSFISTISLADADSKAQQFALLNGQEYANSNGTCTLNSIQYNVNGFNTKTATYNVKFTNNSTSTAYTFTLPSNTSSYSVRGQVPSGTYTVQFFPQSTPVTATFSVNGFTQYSSSGATFYNISISANCNVSMN